MPIKVLVADHLSQEGIDILKAEKEFEVDIKTGLSPKDLAAVIAPYEGVVVRSATKVTAEVIAQADNLKVIGRAGVGLDNVDLEAATRRGIICMNVPAGNTISTAEHTMSMMMALARRIPQADSSLRAGKWERSKFVGTELYGKTLGIIGLGKIGTEVAKRSQSFGMRIIAYDPFLSVEKAQQLGVDLGSVEDVLKGSDFVSVHVPLTPQTKHLIGAEEISIMKDGAFLLNCARGGIVDEEALLKALNDGKLAGAALDVYETEPPKADNPLFKLAQVVVTPHLGASTEEAQQNVAIEISKQVCDCLLGRGIRNAANMPSLDASSAKTLQPYVLLCEKMGSLASQLIESQVSQVQVIFTGEVTLYDSAPLTLAVLKGILEPVVGEGVNYVNASFIASERGIKVIESKASQMEEFANLISIEIKSESQSMIVQGTLSSKKEPRIVRIDRYFVETTPTGFMLFIKNYDRPGLIGHVGSVLGEAGINIASMSNGRDKPGGDAITIVSVDVEVLPKVLEKIKKFEHVIDAKLIKL